MEQAEADKKPVLGRGWYQISGQRAEAIISDITRGSQPELGYYALIAAAAMIAGLGLVANSAAVVIGAMLVSPLMTPIFGMALGMVRGEPQLLGRAVKAEIGGVVLAVAVGAFMGSLRLLTDVTPEMLARTQPNLLDLLVAVFAGLAGTYALIDERISPALPGVAISTAIVPPLATSGLCLAMGSLSGAWGAFLLFFANFLAILMVSSVAFIICGLAGETGRRERKKLVRHLAVASLGFVLVAGLLTNSLLSMISQKEREKTITGVFVAALSKEPNASLENVVFNQGGDKVNVLATIRTPKVIPPERVSGLQQELGAALGCPVQLVVRSALAKDISPTGATSAVVPVGLGGGFITDKLDPDVLKEQLAEQALREILSDSPQYLLLDVDLLYIAGQPVVLASVQSSRALIPFEVAQAEERLRRRVGDPNLRLVARCQMATDITSQGRILYGEAHFGPQPPGAGQVAESVRQAMRGLGDFYAVNLDPILRASGWQARGEVYGPRVLSKAEVARIEKEVAAKVGRPVKLYVWSKAELMVTRDEAVSQEDFTRQRLGQAPAVPADPAPPPAPVTGGATPMPIAPGAEN
ncbi:MAG: DUF389 domain-containing protein [Pseudomonadota bacterium]